MHESRPVHESGKSSKQERLPQFQSFRSHFRDQYHRQTARLGISRFEASSKVDQNQSKAGHAERGKSEIRAKAAFASAIPQQRPEVRQPFDAQHHADVRAS
jgi:hypothetical protein